jgi:hypothetical protein
MAKRAVQAFSLRCLMLQEERESSHIANLRDVKVSAAINLLFLAIQES